MAHMQIETTHGIWYLVEVNGETHYVPPGMVSLDRLDAGQTKGIDDLRDEQEASNPILSRADNDGAATEQWAGWINVLQPYVERAMTFDSVDVIEAWEGWGARYSAPGYMDCTDWVLGDTEEEAVEECKDLYGDDEEEDDGFDMLMGADMGDDEPEEDDYVTTDHRHFYQYGKLAVTVPMKDEFEAEDWRPHVAAHMNTNLYWPSVYLISDHGNSILLSMVDEEESDDE
jgi:hypothetical protein